MRKDLVTIAMTDYPERQREEMRARMREAMSMLDGTNRARVALLTGLTQEQIDDVGGVREDT